MNFRLLLLAFVIFSSCSKESPEPDHEETQEEYEETLGSEIVGNWQWIKSNGGFSGQEINPETEGVNKCLIIDDQTISFITNDTIQEKIGYEIALGKSIYATDSLPIIYLEESIPYSYVFDAASILLREEIYDGYIHEYIRK